MVLYDLPAIRSVAWCGCKVVGIVLYDRHQVGGPGGAARLWG